MVGRAARSLARLMSVMSRSSQDGLDAWPHICGTHWLQNKATGVQQNAKTRGILATSTILRVSVSDQLRSSSRPAPVEKLVRGCEECHAILCDDGTHGKWRGSTTETYSVGAQKAAAKESSSGLVAASAMTVCADWGRRSDGVEFHDKLNIISRPDLAYRWLQYFWRHD